MNYELITNDHHKNNCALFKCSDNRNIFYKKVSFSESSNSIIENEKKGYSWFFSRIGEKDKTELVKTPFYEINIPEFKGMKFPFNYKFPRNATIVELIIEFYKTYWFGIDKIAVQGDLALSNVVCGHNNEIYIIDWEHFHIANSEYFGFDIIHLLFLTIFQRVNKINISEQNFLKNCYNMICDKASNGNKILEKPFVNSQKYMIEFSDQFNLNIPIEEKFVLAQFPKNLLEKLDLIIT